MTRALLSSIGETVEKGEQMQSAGESFESKNADIRY
jgi:hypothetical protein